MPKVWGITYQKRLFLPRFFPVCFWTPGTSQPQNVALVKPLWILWPLWILRDRGVDVCGTGKGEVEVLLHTPACVNAFWKVWPRLSAWYQETVLGLSFCKSVKIVMKLAQGKRSPIMRWNACICTGGTVLVLDTCWAVCCNLVDFLVKWIKN